MTTVTLNPVNRKALYSLGTPYSTWRHKVLPCSGYLRAVKAFMRGNGLRGADSLFVYYHMLQGTFNLALWLVKPGEGKGRGCMREVEVLEGHPDRPGTRLPRADYLFNLLRPSHENFQRLLRQAKDEASKFYGDRRHLEESIEHYCKFLQKKLGPRDNAPYMIRSGLVPFVPQELMGFDPRSEEMADLLGDRKIISTG